MKVAIVHFDISLRTGAQRLILGLGKTLRDLGNEVVYFTAIYDKNTAFDEFSEYNIISSNGKTNTFNKFKAMTAYFESKQMMKAGTKKFNPDLFFFSSNYYLAAKYKPSIIYCHHPEALLLKDKNIVRKLLHYPIDRMEKDGFRKTNAIISNSNYTKTAVRTLFKRESETAYPGVDIKQFEYSSKADDYVLTVNRIMPSKNIELAIEAIQFLKDSKNIRIKLIIAGTSQPGYEWYVEDLKRKIKNSGLEQQIELNLDVKDNKLRDLYHNCKLFIYTPVAEHFGIAPIEAMSCGKPVIAINSAGPSETVINEKTGFLIDNLPDECGKKIEELYYNTEKLNSMGINARKRVEDNFSWGAFSNSIEKTISKTKLH